ncbi:MAG: hypothetical protein JNK82_43160 [Myxococcaceae bacterium]|nr:hypothetical protein [Myxococcaceae bacterium]
MLAWLTVFGAVVAMAFVLRRLPRVRWGPALVVGALALAAHLLDYLVTLYITPDLALEANPLWRIAVRAFGLWPAKVYAFTGKVGLSVFSAQLFAWFLSRPRATLQRGPSGFFTMAAPKASNLAPFFAFSFALFGPYFFYITAYNWLGFTESPWYEKVPSPPLAIALYFAGVGVAYWRVK